MGFFSFIGKAIKGIAHVAGGVAKVAAPFVVGGPLGALGAKLGGSLLGSVLHSKTPLSTHGLKINVFGSRRSIPILRAKNPMMHSTAQRMSQSPVMPGGSVATPQGIMAPGGGVPPSTFGRMSSGPHKRKRSKPKRPSTSRSRSTRKRGAGGRKLKFGSKAWRKKYLKHRK